MLQIDADFLHHVASQAMDAAPPGQIRFAPRVDLTCNAGRALRNLVIASAQAFEAGQLGAATQGLQMMAIERELTLSLLTHQPSNLSHLLNKPLSSLAPRTIRRALDFIHTHYADDICLEDIALATQAHPRTLQIGFQQAYGKSPMGYLRDVRLDMAKFFLARRTDRPKVSDEAYDCGFNHLGRVSRDFRARFGHAPSSECDS
jgi:AraC-like DNA-binding protein